VLPRCVQSDGRFTVYATIEDANHELVATALLKDLVIPAGTTSMNLAIANWDFLPNSVTMSFFDAPAPFLVDVDSGVAPTGSLILQRKGAARDVSRLHLRRDSTPTRCPSWPSSRVG
jgi:hypothetical protein